MTEKILQVSKARNVSNDSNDALKSFLSSSQNVRARSVSKDYQRFTQVHNNWRERQLKVKAQKEMEGCTFKPDIQKSNTNKYKNTQQSTYFSTNLSSAANIPTNASATNSDKLNKEAPQIKTLFPKSQKKEIAEQRLNGMKRFEQLYQVGKVHFQARKKLGERGQEDREFEKQKGECTFKPKKFTKGYKQPGKQAEQLAPLPVQSQDLLEAFQQYDELEHLKQDED